jgi:hypothetical protein
MTAAIIKTNARARFNTDTLVFRSSHFKPTRRPLLPSADIRRFLQESDRCKMSEKWIVEGGCEMTAAWVLLALGVVVASASAGAWVLDRGWRRWAVKAALEGAFAGVLLAPLAVPSARPFARFLTAIGHQSSIRKVAAADPARPQVISPRSRQTNPPAPAARLST